MRSEASVEPFKRKEIKWESASRRLEERVGIYKVLR